MLRSGRWNFRITARNCWGTVCEDRLSLLRPRQWNQKDKLHFPFYGLSGIEHSLSGDWTIVHIGSRLCYLKFKEIGLGIKYVVKSRCEHFGLRQGCAKRALLT